MMAERPRRAARGFTYRHPRPMTTVMGRGSRGCIVLVVAAALAIAGRGTSDLGQDLRAPKAAAKRAETMPRFAGDDAKALVAASRSRSTTPPARTPWTC
jgi:hypothetical protein